MKICRLDLTHCGLVKPYGDRIGSTSAQVMFYYLTVPSHYLKLCWLTHVTISDVQLQSSGGNFTWHVCWWLGEAMSRGISNHVSFNEIFWVQHQVDGLAQERRNSIANTLELRLSCTNPSMWRVAEQQNTFILKLTLGLWEIHFSMKISQIY